MTLSRPSRFGLSLLAITVSLASSIAGVHAAVPTVPWSSVREVVNGKHQGYVTSTFVQPDPAFSGSTADGFNLGLNQESFTNTANQNVTPGGLTGLNIPSLGQGLFPATGQLVTLEAFYSTPSTSTSSADGSLLFVVQTADGLYHTASFATEPSTDQGTNNGRRKWAQFLHSDNSFVPALGAGQAGRIRKEAIVFTGGPNSGFDSVNEVLPPVITDFPGGAFYFISGTNGSITNNPADPNTKANFAVNTHFDSRFNFEL